MKKKLFVTLASLTLMGAYSSASNIVLAQEDSESVSQEESMSDAGIIIEGLGDHYHTGDEVRLIATSDDISDSSNLQWEMRNSSDEDWQIVEGQESPVFTTEASTSESDFIG